MKEPTRVFLFVAIGGFAALVNFVARILIDRTTSYEVAIVLAFPIALTTAFLLNRALVFDGRHGDWRTQFWRFLLVNLVALVQVFVVSVALARFAFPAIGFTWRAHTVAHAIGLASPILTSYWAHKYFSFSKPAAERGRGAETT
jgi:putative flippase GtrA